MYLHFNMDVFFARATYRSVDKGEYSELHFHISLIACLSPIFIILYYFEEKILVISVTTYLGKQQIFFYNEITPQLEFIFQISLSLRRRDKG